MPFMANSPSKVVLCLLMFNSSLVTTTETQNYPMIFNEDNATAPISTCILKILQKYVPCNQFVSVVISGGDFGQDVTKTINEDMCYSVALESHNENIWHLWAETYVVLTGNLNDFSSILLQLTDDVYWNPRARFIIQTNETKKDTIRLMFKMLLTRNIFNVIVLNLQSKGVLIHTYFPFGNGKCGREFEDIKTLGYCTNAVNSSTLFSNKITGNMKNCTFKVVLHEELPSVIFKSSNITVFGRYEPGLEQYMLSIVGVRENFTYNFKFMNTSESFGYVLPNRTVSGLFAYLQAGIADIGVGGLMLTKRRADVFDYIWGHNYETISLFTPVIDSKTWKNVFKELGPRSWTLTMLCYGLVSCISISVATIYPDVAQERVVLVFKLFGFFFQGNGDQSLMKIKRLRLLLCCWIWLTFFISNFYNTALYSMVTSQTGIKQYFDLDNLDNLPFKPCISDNVRSLFLYAYNLSMPDNDPAPACRYIQNALNEVGSRTDLYTIGIKQSFKLREHEFTNIRGQSIIDVRDIYNPCVTVLYIKKGHPLKEKMDKYARLMEETGLMKKQFETLRLRSHSAMMKKSNSFIRVRLDYLKIHFLVLGVGIFVSTLVFLLELVVKRT